VPGTSGNITNLLNQILKAGVVSASSTPTGAGATATEGEKPLVPVDLSREPSRKYRRLVLSQKIKLTTAELTR